MAAFVKNHAETLPFAAGARFGGLKGKMWQGCGPDNASAGLIPGEPRRHQGGEETPGAGNSKKKVAFDFCYVFIRRTWWQVVHKKQQTNKFCTHDDKIKEA